MTHPLAVELRQSATQARAIDRSALLHAAADELDRLSDAGVDAITAYALENEKLKKDLLDLAMRTAEYEPVLQLIAVGARPDGTYNYCREACQKLAQKALGYER